ncbi:hypothetical protein D3C76_1024410 [compost metagenome]
MTRQLLADVVLARGTVMGIEEEHPIGCRSSRHQCRPVTDGIALGLTYGSGMQRESTGQVLGRLGLRVRHVQVCRELREPGVHIGDRRAHERRVVRAEDRLHLRAVLNGVIGGFAVHDQSSVVTTETQFPERDVLNRRAQLVGLLGLPFGLRQVEELLGEPPLGLIAVVEQECLYEREVDLLTNSLVPHSRESAGIRQAAQVIGRGVARASAIRAVLDIIQCPETRHAVDDSIPEARISDQHILLMPIEDLTEEPTHL